MPVDNIVLEKDPFMEKSENYISGEEVTLSASTGRIFALQYGCFFSENLVVRKMPSGDVLRPLIDYTALHLQDAATAESGREVLTVVRIDTGDWAGEYRVDYHAFGGEYSTNAEVIQRLIQENENELENVSWGAIVGKPDQYNPAAHVHDVSSDVYNWNDLVYAINQIRDAVYDGGLSSIDAIFQYIDATRSSLISEIAAAIGVHNTAGTAHGKSAVGLGNVRNNPPANLASINTNNEDYIVASVFSNALFKALSSTPLTVSDPRVVDKPVQCITCNLPSVTEGQTGSHYDRWVLIQGFVGNTIPDNIVTSTTTRWQAVIGIGQNEVGGTEVSNRAMIGIRVGSGTTWSTWINVGKRMLNNVPNYPVADTSPANIAPDTTVDNKLVVPAIAAAIARNAINDSQQTAAQISGGNDQTWVQSDNLEAGKSYMAVITGFLREPTDGTNGVVDNVGMAHRAIDASGNVLGEVVLPAGSFLGLPEDSFGPAMTRTARSPVSMTVTFTAPTGANRRVRFGLDVDTADGSPRGQVTSVALTRLR